MRISTILLAALVLAGAAPSASADTIDRIAAGEPLRIGYRLDAAPFSFADAAGEPAGYTVALCRRIAAALGQGAGAEVPVEFELVTAADRFDALEEGRIDILCEATTATLSRRDRFEFTLLTFASGAAVMVLDGAGIESISDLAGKGVGVLAGTTTETALEAELAERLIEVDLLRVASHEEGLRALESGRIEAYFADRELLIGLAGQAADPSRIGISNRALTYEPYALPVRADDRRLRVAADRALARLFRTGEIVDIYRQWFGRSDPSDILRALFILNSLPE
jgi:ABC-type amino acid transport substrate-binding protein